MEEDIQNHSPTVMFRETPCICNLTKLVFQSHDPNLQKYLLVPMQDLLSFRLLNLIIDLARILYNCTGKYRQIFLSFCLLNLIIDPARILCNCTGKYRPVPASTGQYQQVPASPFVLPSLAWSSLNGKNPGGLNQCESTANQDVFALTKKQTSFFFQLLHLNLGQKQPQ